MNHFCKPMYSYSSIHIQYTYFIAYTCISAHESCVLVQKEGGGVLYIYFFEVVLFIVVECEDNL